MAWYEHCDTPQNTTAPDICETKVRQKALNELAIKALPNPPTGSTKHLDPSLPGFGVRCTAKSKSFFVMFGKDRRLKTLGRWPDMTLREARQEARAILVTPPPKTRLKSLTELLTAFLDDCDARLRPSTVRRYRCAFLRAPDVPLDDVRRTIAKTPQEVAAYKAAFNWAIRSDLYHKNPFQFSQAQFGVRDRVLTDDEIATLWHYEDKPFSDVVKLLLLTGQRRSQMVSIQPSWIDGDTISFPASIMKSKRPHTIPFNLLTAQYLRPIRFNGWGKSKKRMDEATGVTDWVLHDLRRFYSTTMAKLGVPLHITEHLLDHRTSTSGVQAVYMRYGFLPEMREAVSQFESHIAKLISA